MITFTEVESTVRQIVAEMPDFVYREFRAKQLNKPVFSQAQVFNTQDGFACVYKDEDGEPSCIFGVALTRLGLEPIEDMNISDLLEELKIYPSLEQAKWCNFIQSEQDRYLYTWSEILEHADEEYLVW